jgi:hypothetical protein
MKTKPNPKTTKINPRPLTPDEMERVSDVLASGPLTKRPGDDEFIERGLFTLYEDDANAVEGTDGAVESFYDYSPGARIRGAIRPEWLPSRPGHTPR